MNATPRPSRATDYLPLDQTAAWTGSEGSAGRIHFDRLRRWAYCKGIKLGCPDCDAEDLASSFVLSILRHQVEVATKPPKVYGKYVNTAYIHHFADYCRKQARSRRNTADPETMDHLPDDGGISEVTGEVAALQTAASLDPSGGLARIASLRKEGFTWPEAAKEVGLSTSTLKNRMERHWRRQDRATGARVNS